MATHLARDSRAEPKEADNGSLNKQNAVALGCRQDVEEVIKDEGPVTADCGPQR